MAGVVAVDLGGTFIKAGIVIGGAIVCRDRRTTQVSHGADAIMRSIVELINRLLDRHHMHAGGIDGIGVAVPSQITSDGRSPVAPINVPCLKNVPVAEKVAEPFGWPCVIENDANAAALGERSYGLGRGSSHLIALTLGTGVGGGVISEGRLLRGPINASGDLGHILVEPGGRKCACGRRGCLEAHVSTGALVDRGKQLCPDLELDLATGPLVLAEAARHGEPEAIQIFDEVGYYLGQGIADLVHIFGPDLIILGGGLSEASDLFGSKLRETLREQCTLQALCNHVRIEVSELRDDAALLGLAAAFEETNSQRSARPHVGMSGSAETQLGGGPEPVSEQRSEVGTGRDTEFLLELVMDATRRAASVVRDTVWSKSYYDDHEARRYAGTGAHHMAPVLDKAAHQAIVDTIEESCGSYFLVSEEADGHTVCKGSDDGDLCFIADPLDGSAFARRRMPLASSSLCAYSRTESRAIASAVTDVFLGVTYYTADYLDGSFMDTGVTRYQISTSGCEELECASCAVLGTDRDRLAAVAEQQPLVQQIHWMLNCCGAMEICRVAAGDIDIAAEFAKGFHIWDLAAASHILQNAGGTIASPEGNPIALPSSLDQRYRFIATATKTLFDHMRQAVTWSP